MSVHAAGAAESQDHYVWERLDVAKFEDGVAACCPRERITNKMREYAIAGTLHLDHLAALRRTPAGMNPLEVPAFHLSQALGIERAEVLRRLERLIAQHATEWSSFVSSLGARSFIRGWAMETES
jgi:hypothetical protein